MPTQILIIKKYQLILKKNKLQITPFKFDQSSI